ncbi:MAG: hypothetical protein ACREHD_32630, partial [Pirellulales bacterium]
MNRPHEVGRERGALWALSRSGNHEATLPQRSATAGANAAPRTALADPVGVTLISPGQRPGLLRPYDQVALKGRDNELPSDSRSYGGAAPSRVSMPI